MEGGIKGGSSRRKSVPLKVCLALGPMSAKKTAISAKDDHDIEVVSDPESATSDQSDKKTDKVPEGIIVVQPEPVQEKKIRFRGPEFKATSKKGYAAALENLFCTACGKQVNPWKTGMLKKHKELQVLICRKCWNFLGSGEIAKDEDGMDEQCRWCGEGGRLTVCDKCPQAFCKGCIMRNFGRAAFTTITEKENWECYFCDPTPLEELRKQCVAVFEAIATTDEKKSSRPTESAVRSQQGLKLQKRDDPTGLHKMLTNFDLNEDNIVMITSQLYEAISAFQCVLKSTLQASGIQNGSDRQMSDDELQTFTASSEMSDTQRKRQCTKVVKKGLDIFTCSLGKIISMNSKTCNRNSGHGVNPKLERELPSKSARRKCTTNTSHGEDTCDQQSTTPCDCSTKSDASPGNASLDRDEAPALLNTVSGRQDEKQVKEKLEINKDKNKDTAKKDVGGKSSLSHKATGRRVNESTTCEQRDVNSCVDGFIDDEISEILQGKKLQDLSEQNEQGLISDLSQEKKPANRTTKRSVQQCEADEEEVECLKKSNQDGDENVLAKFELIQELAEECCKESEGASNAEEESMDDDKCNIESDDDLPCVTFEVAKEKSVKQKKPDEKKMQDRDKSLENKAFSDISDSDAAEECRSTDSKPVKVKTKQIRKEESDKGMADTHGWKDLNSESSVDIFTSSEDDGESRSRRRRRKAKGRPSSAKGKKKAENEASGDETDEKTKYVSKRRVKTTPKKDAHRKHLSHRRRCNTKSEDSMDDAGDVDGDVDLDPAEDSSSKAKKADSNGELNRSNISLEDDTAGDEKHAKQDEECDVEERPSEDKEARKKKKMDLSQEAAQLEKEVEALISGKCAKKKSRLEADEEEDAEKKSSRRKGTPKKVEKDKLQKKGSNTDDSIDSSGEEEEESYEEEDDENEEVKEMSKSPARKVQRPSGDLENELAKEEMMEQMEDEDVNDESVSDSSSESDIGAVRKRKGQKPDKTKEEKDGATDDDESDFEPVKRKRFRNKLLDEKLSASDSDSDDGKKRTRKRKKKDSEDESFASEGSQSSSDEDDDSVVNSDAVNGSDEDALEDSATEGKKQKGRGKGKSKGKEKGKKRKRIKIKESSSEQEEEPDGEGSGDKTSRKKIRKLMSDRKLADDTKAAARAEEERRKRVAEKQKKFNRTETKEVGEGQAPITTKLILEQEEKTGDPIVQVDSKLICKLKPHQVEAVQFMWDCLFESLERAKKEDGSGCILAHCMGLGKTLSVVAFVHTLLSNQKLTKVKTCLVVCPLNTVLNWMNEWQIWFDEDEKLNVYEMASVKQNWSRADVLEEWHNNGGVMIMGYEMLRNLSQGSRVRNKKQKALFAKTLLNPGPDVVVCDEGHIMKNAASALSKAMNQIKTRRRIVLTGTPLQNNLIEYHCMVDFVKPNLLGTRKEFANRFVNPITNGQHSDSTPRDVRIMKARAHILHELLAGCVQRRDYSALTKFLPPKQEYVISVRLKELQVKLYQEYLNRTGQVDGQITTRGAQLFKDYQNLMKIWTHPWVLKLAEIRDENKMKYDDEDSFIDDSEMEDEKEFIASDTSSEESLPNVSEDEESAGEGSSMNRRSRRLRNRNRSDDKEEVVKEWKTRSRGGEDGSASLAPQVAVKCKINIALTDADVGAEEAAPQAVSSEWWAQYLTEDDQTKMEHSGKLVLLFDILRMCEEIGDKVLIFSQSLLSLDIIEYFLEHVDTKFQAETAGKKDEELPEQFGKRWTKGEDYFRLDGSTSAQLRQCWAGIFNDPENLRARLFLISTRAGGLGINLVGANRVIIFDASWNPSHDVQSIFRVYRFGQSKPCYIYRFLAQGTMEEKIYERQITKLSLSQRVVDEHQVERHFTSADLQELYAFKPDRLSDDKEKPTLMLPKDPLLAEIMSGQRDWFVNLHEHDSLLENLVEQELTEEEKKAAWEEYENEKKGLRMNAHQGYGGLGLTGFLSQEYLLQTARNLREQNPDMPQEELQMHLQRIIMMQIRQKQEEQRRLDFIQRQQETQFAQMRQHYAQLQQQYLQQYGHTGMPLGMFPPHLMPPSTPGSRFSPSLYAHMAQPGLSVYHEAAAMARMGNMAGASASGTSGASSKGTNNSKGANSSKTKAEEVINLDESS